MIRPPPRSTRTDTPVPYSTLFRSLTDLTSITGRQMVAVDVRFAAVSAGTLKALGFNFSKLGGDIQGALAAPDSLGGVSLPNTGVPAHFDLDITAPRSETRRVGNRCGTKYRYMGAAYLIKKNNK